MEALEIYKAVKKTDSIKFVFWGGLTQEILVEFANYMKSQYFRTKMANKLLSVFVELWQNIMHYSSERVILDDKEIGSGIIIFAEHDFKYIISSGNKVVITKKDKITNRLMQYKGKNSNELKELYFKIINQDTELDSKGAGLGFVEIARKCNGNFDFSFTDLDENYSFFELNVEIAKG